LALENVERDRFGAPTSPAFARLCEELAGATEGGRWSPARNGAIIEQAQIRTTHNLAVLFADLGLQATLTPRLPELARRCFAWVCRNQQLTIRDWRAQLQMLKNTAYAWRQMLFFVSLLSPSDVAAFQDRSTDYLAEQRSEFAERFQPVLSGLRAVIQGECFDADGWHAASGGRRFLGRSQGRHWLLPGGDGSTGTSA
jgi:hypothetical protein